MDLDCFTELFSLYEALTAYWNPDFGFLMLYPMHAKPHPAS